MGSKTWLACLLILSLVFTGTSGIEDDDDYEFSEVEKRPDAGRSGSGTPGSGDLGVVSFLIEHSIPAFSSDAADSVPVRLDASVLLGESGFSPRTQVSFRNPIQSIISSGGVIVPRQLDFQPASISESQDAARFKTLLEQDGYYRIRIPSNLRNPKSGSYVMASLPACALAASSFQELVTLHVDHTGAIISVQYQVPVALCPERLPQVSLPNAINTTLRLAYCYQGSRPISVGAVPIVDAGGKAPAGTAQQGTEAAPAEQPSFFKKYWFFIVPFVLMMLLNNPGTEPPSGGPPRPGAGGGGASRGAAGGGAPSPGGGGSRQRRPAPR